MKQLQIHQFSPSANAGDGVTNGMFYLQSILQELGCTSHIYAQNIEKTLSKKVQKYTKFDTKNKEQILFIHYSLYYDFSKWLDSLDVKKVLIYHNITPHTFFAPSDPLHNLCKIGKEYLPELAKKVLASIGVSKLNTQELIKNGFTNPHTIPLLVDMQKIQNAPFNTKLFDTNAVKFNIIFVGRIAPNKAQHDLIEIAKVYATYSKDFKLTIIGGTTDLAYEQRLKREVQEANLQNNIIFTGKIPNEDLYAYYRAANIFLCMSEHEGFGIPLIESMLFDTPVIAYNSSNIKSTMNGGGILFNEKSPKHIAATIDLLRTKPAFKTEILNTQREAIKSYTHQSIIEQLLSFFSSINIEIIPPKQEQEIKNIKYQFEGPFDSSYSLAMLNRYSALAFEELFPSQVALFATEGGGDYEANKKFLTSHPKTQELHTRAKKAQQCEVVFRNLYPPRVTGMKGELNLLNSYGWEESAFAKEYVNNFNEHLDGITVMSKYVKKVLQGAGVTTPIAVVGLGVEHILEKTPKPLTLKTDKTFKFLHISSCFPRKGVDTLLQAYSQAFTKADDVVLIIKTFPNPHNDVAQQIKELHKNNKNSPEILLINEDLESEYILWLYQNTDALVAPSRGEGFGLPMAEAMLCRLPVITTGFGGQVDFCHDENSWLIDYSFTKAQTHMQLFNSYWVEPDVDDLTKLLKEQLTLTPEQKKKKTDKAYTLISQEFTWQNYAKKSLSFIEKLKTETIFEKEQKNIAWVSTYNTKCGIASYSEFLLQHLEKAPYKFIKYADYADTLVNIDKENSVIRCWRDRNDKNVDNLVTKVLAQKPHHILINFNFGFFSMQNLETMLHEFQKHHIKTTIIFHSVQDIVTKTKTTSLGSIKETLKKVERLLVHNISDLNILKSFDLVQNVTLFPHGVQKRVISKQTNEENFTIASYGFMLPHKGIAELIEAFAILHKKEKKFRLVLVNALYPNPISDTYLKKCQKLIKNYGLQESITLINEFLDDDASAAYLEKADLLVMPYIQTQESSSAAVRYAISIMKPVLCTPINIFNDVQEIVHFTQGTSVDSLAQAIHKLYKNPKELQSKNTLQQRWIDEHQWSATAQCLAI